MVCPLGSGRMKALARLLVAKNIQQAASDEAGRLKFAAQYIQRELREADESNLIDEEDMHIFGLRPLTDPLHLVCCNACKKPIKASQYVAHTELCKSLYSAEDIVLEVNGGATHKKRPRKERKKSLTASSNQPRSVRKQAKLELLESDFAALPCCSEEHLSTVSFLEDKRISSHLNVATMRSCSMVTPGLVDCSEGVISHQEKHSKIFGAANIVTKSWPANSGEGIPCEEHQERSSAGSDNTGSPAIAVKIPTQVQKFRLKVEDVPNPLATKMYYSQRQHRLKSALSYLYREGSCNDSGSEFACPKVLKSNVMPADILYHSNNSHIQIDYQQEKCWLVGQAHEHSLPLVRKPNVLQMVDSGVCPPPMNIASQFPVNNILTITSIGVTNSNYNSISNSFAGHSGKQLQPKQQAEGNSAVVQNY
ncbi:uncharacterized protein LOC107819966 isoform X2 [Nicotiana tabacum]|uniref:Uncharacterized protein LOC107819966 isoform X2 n=2 Tax=Nicotiana TaxID=4085 RepID=A0A1S4CKD9_TOBAC|nr:PREDICTED: uncharacterized protein LOC104240240 isoform X2 [Nicotiana sylvestris]XP_016501658.1 PREDICTED: uncharacterized protein LOC107819966 isoform X2 [Nicotiana tabacum]